MRSLFPIAFLMGPTYYFIKFYCLSLYIYIISQSGSFALPAVMGGTGITLLSQSTLTLGLQWTMFPSPRLENPSSGQSLNILT